MTLWRYMAAALFMVLSCFALLAQEMSKNQLLDMPYAKVKEMLSSPAQAAKLAAMAKKDDVILMGGVAVEGKKVSMKGELTGANCYLSRGLHGPRHALCAKACVAEGSPVVFLAEDGKVYLVLTPKDGVPLPEKALDDLGQPGVTIDATLVSGHGAEALAIDSVHS